MENNENLKELVLNADMKKDLITMSLWVKFLSILGFVGIGFMLIAAFVMMAGRLMMSSMYYQEELMFTIIAVVYIAMAIAYFFPVLYMFKSTLEISKGIKQNDSISLAAGFKNLKAHFKYMGIMIIVLFGIYLLAIIGVIAFAALNLV